MKYKEREEIFVSLDVSLVIFNNLQQDLFTFKIPASTSITCYT